MRRLDDRGMMDSLLLEKRLQIRHIERLSNALASFYRRAPAVLTLSEGYIQELRRTMAYNKRVLLDRRFNLPAGLVRRVDQCQHVFLNCYRSEIAARFQHRRVVDGHGDLRPEHICFEDRVRIIDCLEFNARLRILDPIDEIAYLALECERLGAPWAGRTLRQRMKHKLRDGTTDVLFDFYTCYRATLRARLAIAHLYEDSPRTPEKWPRLAIDYLQLASRSARRLERSFRTRSNR
jgi:aminoglycoside phosphotransferase family enzyme